jgi:aryl sulfotransferase
MSLLPERSRTYQNHHLDSTRWDGFTPRPDDIVIATPYKAGTT